MQRNLLLVDDEKNIQQALLRALKRAGYPIFCASSGEAALAIMAQEKIHVIISDQRMPGMSGSELFQEISQRFPATIRIVLSGYADFSAVTEAINRGAIYKFLSKPWDDKLLISHVDEAFQRYELVWRNRQLTEVFKSTIEGIMITDHMGIIQSINPAFTTITGYFPDDVVGKNSRSLSSEKNSFLAMKKSIVSTGEWHGEQRGRRKNGDEYPQWMTVSTLPGEQGEQDQYVALFIDISEQKEREACIEHQAYHDELTGLPNRRLFHDRLTQLLAQAIRNDNILAILFIDLDRFKVINDSLGHAVGDELLKLAAQRLMVTMREEDTVARLGGDEFTILLPRVKDHDAAKKAAGKIISAFSLPFVMDEHTLHISPSIGIALSPTDGDTPERLMKNADSAMYRAKAAGRNAYCFYSQNMNASAKRLLILENDLHDALARHELVPYYQLQNNIAQKKISGMEVLLRWQHPKHGLVMPTEFIALAEESGLINPIGRWVLEQACQQAKIWLAAGCHDFNLAVNLSARQLQQSDLLQLVQKTLEMTGLPAQYLELEITENLLMTDTKRNIALLNSLHDLGVRLALDDFGTGYSSLSYLKKFSFDLLKIDQSFVRGLPENQEDAVLVDTIITMGHKLGMKVIAEGVETKEQFMFLHDLGCDLAQGYFIGRPMPAEEVEKFLLTDLRSR